MLKVFQLPILTDNYCFILRNESENLTACIDPGEAQPVIDFLEKNQWPLNYIYNTHHHWDHVNGNKQLKEKYNCPVYCSSYDIKRLCTADKSLEGDKVYTFGESIYFKVIDIPGHTLGHIAFYFFEDDLIFVGDTLFSMGCGRLFEGSPEMMWNSLQKLKALPPKTKIYCGHEYTEANTSFCRSVFPNDPEIKEFENWVQDQRAQNIPTVPTSLERELKYNIFLQCDQKKVQELLESDEALESFTTLRLLRNTF